MDFVEGFPKVGGKSVVLTIVDHLSKYAHFITLGHPYTAMSITKAFFEHVIRLHGIPASIVSDRDPIFTSAIWQELFRLCGTQLRLSSAFHPQTDGLSEVMNRIITVYLHCLAGDRPKSWLQWLSWTEYCYNTSYQTALKATPFQPGATRVAAVEHQLRDRDTFLSEIKDRLLQAQTIMKTAHDEYHRQLDFAVGDWVWLRLNQRVTASIRDNPPSKLAHKYFEPYKVLQRIGEVTYKLQLPKRACIHDVFHVTFLKKFEGSAPTEVPLLPPIAWGRVVPQPD
jgi:hypothetical protein